MGIPPLATTMVFYHFLKGFDGVQFPWFQTHQCGYKRYQHCKFQLLQDHFRSRFRWQRVVSHLLKKNHGLRSDDLPEFQKQIPAFEGEDPSLRQSGLDDV